MDLYKTFVSLQDQFTCMRFNKAYNLQNFILTPTFSGTYVSYTESKKL